MNKPPAGVRKVDRREERTRRALGRALVDLMHARSFAEIRVEDVLERADVGRSTFYDHFKNKDDLLLSDAERFVGAFCARFLDHARKTPGSRRLAPVAELLAHVANVRDFHRSLETSGLQQAVYDLFVGHLARLLEARLGDVGSSGPEGLSRGVTARILAGSLVEMLRWWLPREPRPTPEAMDEHFHAIAWGGACGGAPPASDGPTERPST